MRELPREAVRNLSMPTAEHGLATILHDAIAHGAYGLTIWSGRPVVVHSEKGPHPLEGSAPSTDEVVALVRALTDSRQMRALREVGAISFMRTLDLNIRLVGRARQHHGNIGLEVRRIAGQQSSTANSRTATDCG